jgi:hypothetical protein
VSNQFGTSAPHCQVVNIFGIGLEEFSSNGSFKAYPVPFTDKLFITFEGVDKPELLQLMVHTLTGQRVAVDYSLKDDRMELTRGNLANGYYLFEITSNNHPVARGKFLVN